MSVDPIETSEALPRGAIVEQGGQMSRAFRNWLERGSRQTGKVISGIAALQSAVQVTQGAVAGINDQLDAFYGVAVDGGGNGAFLKLSDNSALGSAIAIGADEIFLDANAINFGAQTSFDLTSETFITEVGGVRSRYGTAFGASGSQVVMWHGPTSVAQGSESRTNGYLAIGTNGLIYHNTSALDWGATASAAAAQTSIGTAAAIAGQGWGATASEGAASNTVPRAEAQRPNLVPVKYQLFGLAGDLPFSIGNGSKVSTSTVNPFLNRAAQRFNTSGAGNMTIRFTPDGSYNVTLPPGRYGVKLAIHAPVEIKQFLLVCRDSGGTSRAAFVVSNTASDPQIVEGVWDLSASPSSLYRFEVRCDMSPATAGNGVYPYRFQVEAIPAAATGPGEWTGFDARAAGIEDGADVTGGKTAAAITGQGVFATGNYFEQGSDPGSVANGSIWFNTSTDRLYIRRTGSWGFVADIAPASLTVTPSTGSVSGGALPNNTATTGNVSFTVSGGSGTYTWQFLGGPYQASVQRGSGASTGNVNFSKTIVASEDSNEPATVLFMDSAGRTGTGLVNVNFFDNT